MPEIEIHEHDEAAAIAATLIPQHHPHLRDARILYLVTSQAMRSRDRAVLGKASKLGPLPRYLSAYRDYDADMVRDPELEEGYDFLLLFNQDEWDALSTPQRRAAVDHELSHCGCRETVHPDGTVERKWVLVGHDLEEFAVVVQRHGLWRPDVQTFATVAAQQLRLPEPFAAPDVVKQAAAVVAAVRT